MNVDMEQDPFNSSPNQAAHKTRQNGILADIKGLGAAQHVSSGDRDDASAVSGSHHSKGSSRLKTVLGTSLGGKSLGGPLKLMRTKSAQGGYAKHNVGQTQQQEGDSGDFSDIEMMRVLAKKGKMKNAQSGTDLIVNAQEQEMNDSFRNSSRSHASHSGRSTNTGSGRLGGLMPSRSFDIFGSDGNASMGNFAKSNTGKNTTTSISSLLMGNNTNLNFTKGNMSMGASISSMGNFGMGNIGMGASISSMGNFGLTDKMNTMLSSFPKTPTLFSQSSKNSDLDHMDGLDRSITDITEGTAEAVNSMELFNDANSAAQPVPYTRKARNQSTAIRRREERRQKKKSHAHDNDDQHPPAPGDRSPKSSNSRIRRRFERSQTTEHDGPMMASTGGISQRRLQRSQTMERDAPMMASTGGVSQRRLQRSQTTEQDGPIMASTGGIRERRLQRTKSGDGSMSQRRIQRTQMNDHGDEPMAASTGGISMRRLQRTKSGDGSMSQRRLQRSQTHDHDGPMMASVGGISMRRIQRTRSGDGSMSQRRLQRSQTTEQDGPMMASTGGISQRRLQRNKSMERDGPMMASSGGRRQLRSQRSESGMQHLSSPRPKRNNSHEDDLPRIAEEKRRPQRTRSGELSPPRPRPANARDRQASEPVRANVKEGARRTHKRAGSESDIRRSKEKEDRMNSSKTRRKQRMDASQTEDRLASSKNRRKTRLGGGDKDSGMSSSKTRRKQRVDTPPPSELVENGMSSSSKTRRKQRSETTKSKSGRLRSTRSKSTMEKSSEESLPWAWENEKEGGTERTLRNKEGKKKRASSRKEMEDLPGLSPFEAQAQSKQSATSIVTQEEGGASLEALTADTEPASIGDEKASIFTADSSLDPESNQPTLKEDELVNDATGEEVAGIPTHEVADGDASNEWDDWHTSAPDPIGMSVGTDSAAEGGGSVVLTQQQRLSVSLRSRGSSRAVEAVHGDEGKESLEQPQCKVITASEGVQYKTPQSSMEYNEQPRNEADSAIAMPGHEDNQDFSVSTEEQIQDEDTSLKESKAEDVSIQQQQSAKRAGSAVSSVGSMPGQVIGIGEEPKEHPASESTHTSSSQMLEEPQEMNCPQQQEVQQQQMQPMISSAFQEDQGGFDALEANQMLDHSVRHQESFLHQSNPMGSSPELEENRIIDSSMKQEEGHVSQPTTVRPIRMGSCSSGEEKQLTTGSLKQDEERTNETTVVGPSPADGDSQVIDVEAKHYEQSPEEASNLSTISALVENQFIDTMELQQRHSTVSKNIETFSPALEENRTIDNSMERPENAINQPVHMISSPDQEENKAMDTAGTEQPLRDLDPASSRPSLDMADAIAEIKRKYGQLNNDPPPSRFSFGPEENRANSVEEKTNQLAYETSQINPHPDLAEKGVDEPKKENSIEDSGGAAGRLSEESGGVNSTSNATELQIAISEDMDEADHIYDDDSINFFEDAPASNTFANHELQRETNPSREVQDGQAQISADIDEASHIEDSLNNLLEDMMPGTEMYSEDNSRNMESLDLPNPSSMDLDVGEAGHTDDSIHLIHLVPSKGNRMNGAEHSGVAHGSVEIEVEFEEEADHINDEVSLDPLEALLGGSVEARTKALESGHQSMRDHSVSRGRSKSSRLRQSKMHDSSKKHEKKKRSKSGRDEKHHSSRKLGGSSRRDSSYIGLDGSSIFGSQRLGSSRRNHSTREGFSSQLRSSSVNREHEKKQRRKTASGHSPKRSESANKKREPKEKTEKTEKRRSKKEASDKEFKKRSSSLSQSAHAMGGSASSNNGESGTRRKSGKKGRRRSSSLTHIKLGVDESAESHHGETSMRLSSGDGTRRSDSMSHYAHEVDESSTSYSGDTSIRRKNRDRSKSNSQKSSTNLDDERGRAIKKSKSKSERTRPERSPPQEQSRGTKKDARMRDTSEQSRMRKAKSERIGHERHHQSEGQLGLSEEGSGRLSSSRRLAPARNAGAAMQSEIITAPIPEERTEKAKRGRSGSKRNLRSQKGSSARLGHEETAADQLGESARIEGSQRKSRPSSAPRRNQKSQRTAENSSTSLSSDIAARVSPLRKAEGKRKLRSQSVMHFA